MNPAGDGDQLEQLKKRLNAPCPYLGKPCPQDSSQCRRWITMKLAMPNPQNLSLPPGAAQIQEASMCMDDRFHTVLEVLNHNMVGLITVLQQMGQPRLAK